MEEQPPKISSARLLIYLIGRLNEQHARTTDIHIGLKRLELAYKKQAFQSNVLAVGTELVRGIWMFSAQASTIFIASYVAFEHSWYVDMIGRYIKGIGQWIHQTLSFLF